MLQQTVHLFDSKLHGEELVEKTECSGGPPAIASHPRFHVFDTRVDLINDFMIGFQPVELLKVFRRQNVHAKNLLHQQINGLPRSLDLHFFRTIFNPNYKERDGIILLSKSLCDLHTSKSRDEKGMAKTKEITDKVSAKKPKTTKRDRSFPEKQSSEK